MSDLPDIVLVHGAWADGSSWSTVIEHLQDSGYQVTAPQFPMTSLAADVARLRQVLARQDDPVIVVGHSYGGQIITALGRDAPNVAGLVYIAAFGLDEGEAIGELLGQGPPSPALANLITDEQGFAWLPEEDFVGHFAADVDPVRARVMWAVQHPLSAAALQEVMGVPAWKSRPSWFLVAAGDQAIPPDAERQFAARMAATTVGARVKQPVAPCVGWAVAAGRSCGVASPACAVLAGTMICSSLQRVACRWVPAVVAAPARDWSEAVFCLRLRRDGGEEVD